MFDIESANENSAHIDQIHRDRYIEDVILRSVAQTCWSFGHGFCYFCSKADQNP